jgi:hypothetical protein
MDELAVCTYPDNTAESQVVSRGSRDPEPPPYILQIAELNGYTKKDLVRVYKATGGWPSGHQIEAAAGRRIATILNSGS